MIASTWLCLMLTLAAYAWFAYRTPYVLPILAAAAAFAMYVPTGTPRLTAPPAGHYEVLGADIVVDQYIDALLKPEGGEAMLYRLPYSTAQANALQAAKDGGNGVSAEVGTDGGVAYDGDPPVTDTENKHAEEPQLNVGG
ncbi:MULTISPECIES: hypothetical protein [unclassified Mesorhizobium]|uniref:hypothetical protein n=1 Tax=unclassified Mesorhizobium TaxID=325217 RepID=UPI00112BF757|nr:MULTISPECIES: hypothetical protein [unclassified Mesorhizobium]TPJ86980.1 hypothetical protein FJ489_31010 [Mesorhizobium sp. B2-5-12]TPK19203.1 hypothetical protein FJ562_31415 [Mesorhizobium sp. B2-5-6]